MNPAPRLILLLTLIFPLLFIFSACGPSFLHTQDLESPSPAFTIGDDAEITDTPESRSVLKVAQDYCLALNQKDFDKLRPLISSSYYENASTTDDSSDDYGNESLEDIFIKISHTVQEIRINMVIHRLSLQGDLAEVDYEQRISFRYQSSGRDIWSSNRTVNRLTLVREKDQWKIKSGM